MTIFRGPGGTGSATSDSDTTEFQEFLVQSQAARDAALAAQAAAELAETNAETAETNAETAETNAETAATSATSSASAASISASNAATSASNAASSATSAANSASAAAASAASINPADIVHISGTETITGSKTFSSNPTLSGGTANGVAYLNGSKVLTTGSGLVFDGTNIGLGVTPSASTGYKNVQNGNAVMMGSTSDVSAYWNSNATFNSGWKYISNGTSARYEQTSLGAHAWFTAPSGTAGNAISFTQAMTLDASGNLIIGDTSQVGSSKISMTVNPSLANVLAAKTSTNGDVAAFRILSSDGNEQGAVNVNTSGQNMTFRVANTERARIDSSGNLLVGTTSGLGTAGKVQFVQPAAGSAGAGISVDATSGTFSYSVAWFAANRSASSAFNFINCTSDQYNSPQFRVQGNGVILAQNTTVQSISDARTKENIRDSEDGLQVILALQPRRFDFKQGFGNGRKNVLGFVAQEIETVFPDAVSEVHLDPDSKDVAYKTVGPGELIPVLVKAIQEQQAIITAQATQIQQLRERVLEVEEGTSNMLVENTNNLYETITALTARVAALESN